MTYNVKRKANVTCEFPTHESTNSKDKREDVKKAWNLLKDKACPNPEMTDWLDWPEKYLYSPEYQELQEIADEITLNFDVVVFIGIGASYLTGKMILNSFYGDFYNCSTLKTAKIYFAGYDLDADNLCDLFSYELFDKKVALVYISRNGDTLEPAITFNIMYDTLLVNNDYDKEAVDKCVFVVTDSQNSILREAADKNHWKSFVIPNGIGDRFSGLTPVGILPAAIAGLDVEDLLLGAAKAVEDCFNDPNALAFQYAEWRHRHSDFDTAPHFNSGARWYHGHIIEFMATNTETLSCFTEWWKHLFGESEGKKGVGIFPASGVFPRDLHSLGQFLQDGTRGLIFETQLICDFVTNYEITESVFDDKLDKFYGKTISQAAEATMHSAYVAHTESGNPCGIIRFEKTEYELGYLMQNMFISAAISALMFKVNPFDQPGVEKYEEIMKETLSEMNDI